jgi:MFS family permease
LRLGLRENWAQFSLLVLVNAFVGAMAGLERSILPALAEQEFGLASRSAILSFLVAFGLTKAIANYFSGRLADRFGRKAVLVAGWLIAAPVPFMLMAAPGWDWIVAANVFLGVSQGLTWSLTVIMKIDLAGPRQRGLAMGLNEFAGYAAVAASAWATAAVAASWGLRPEPFYLGVGYVLLGFSLSALLVRDTRGHAELESALAAKAPRPPPGARDIFWRVTAADRNLSSASQAGLVNNLNDGVAWGLFPLWFAASQLSLAQVGLLAALYPATWGVAQLATGAWSDRIGRKPLVVSGMWIQAAGIAIVAALPGLAGAACGSLLLGIGTACVYPTLLAVVGDVAEPAWRASAVGVYRLWRDLGYAAGAVVSGALADAFGLAPAILAVAALTFASGALAALRMGETLRPP